MAKEGSIFDRIGDIMSSNIHALLDKCENPEKMLDQNMRKAVDDLADLKESAVQLKADQKAAQRAYAKAVASEARIKEQEVDLAQKNLNAANSNYETVQKAYNKLASDIEFMKNQMNHIKSTMRTAKATEKVAAMKDPSLGYSEAFSKYSEKAQRMLDEANAKIEMNDEPVDELSALRSQYAGTPVAPDMSDALMALKAECGMGES